MLNAMQPEPDSHLLFALVIIKRPNADSSGAPSSGWTIARVHTPYMLCIEHPNTNDKHLFVVLGIDWSMLVSPEGVQKK